MNVDTTQNKKSYSQENDMVAKMGKYTTQINERYLQRFSLEYFFISYA